MTVRTIRTTKIEADHIINNQLHHIFRSNKERIRAGDTIQFLVYKDGKPVAHSINSRAYVVTIVQDDGLAPVQAGWQAVGFR